MNTIIIDADELHRFRQKLLDTVDTLKEQLAATRTSVEEVSQAWKDNQFKKFKEDFEADAETIEPLCDAIAEVERENLAKREELVNKYFEIL